MRRNESFGNLMLKSPWWVSAMLGVLSFAGLRWGLRAWWGDTKAFQPFETLAGHLAPVVALIFGLLAGMSFWLERRRRGLVDQQTGLESLRSISWKDFELLLAEAYRRHGYQVDYSLGKGADGGVDLVLRRTNRTFLVQCKQWKVFSVGAPVVRELFGIMMAERADEAIVVTSGAFTREAVEFARGKPIQLVDGPKLLELVRQVQRQEAARTVVTDRADGSTGPPSCPVCGGAMILRTARRGQTAGSQFWGCPVYPGCKGTREY